MARDEKGRFQKGNNGGPGRPTKEREVRFYEITLSSVTFDDWRAIVERAVADAKRGDASARKWLADYLIGTPEQRLDITTNGETLNTTVFDYATAVAAIAPGSAGDSSAPGENQSDCDGAAVG
jgi:hypothetical protein